MQHDDTVHERVFERVHTDPYTYGVRVGKDGYHQVVKLRRFDTSGMSYLEAQELADEANNRALEVAS